jgi:DNA-binding transcriptional MerR regulator
MHKPKLSEYVKVAEVAEILGVSQGTVRAWAEAGKIPMRKTQPTVTGSSGVRSLRSF